MYRQFNDSTFLHQMERNENETHLGILGPIIRGTNLCSLIVSGVVGDNITIVFKNMARFNFSLAAHGVVTDKANDGALYDDNTSGLDKTDDAIQPNGTFTYHWIITELNGPASGDPSSIIFPYHSLVHEREDINSGLYGVTIITRYGKHN